MDRDTPMASVTTTPNATPQGNRLTGVVALTTADAWAAGYAEHATAPTVRPVTARWNGTVWTLVPTPTPAGGRASTTSTPAPRTMSGLSGRPARRR